jgi:2-pyrone-4,6-dicarboxylate lactonase
MPQVTYLPFDPELTAPRRRLPEKTCDCHFHVFENKARYPFSEPRSYTPTEATLHNYLAMARTLGIDRAVLIQPSVYGQDHRLYEDILSNCATWMKGVAVVTENTPSPDVERWNDLGTRGARVNALFTGGASLKALNAIVEKIRPVRWHLQILIDIAEYPLLLGTAAEQIPIVVDHMGHFQGTSTSTPGFQNLISLLREGRTWVKLSGAYRLTHERKGFGSLRGLIDAMVEANADRLVWGSDWPHPAMTAPMVNDGNLADALFDWLDDATLHKVLVDNPLRLYWQER